MRRIRWDMVNEWAVCILLECILVFFSCVCPSFYPQGRGRGSHVTITNDGLDLTVQGPPGPTPAPLDIRPGIPSPATRTSDTPSPGHQTWDTPLLVTSGGDHWRPGRYISYWNAFLLHQIMQVVVLLLTMRRSNCRHWWRAKCGVTTTWYFAVIHSFHFGDCLWQCNIVDVTLFKHSLSISER